MYRWYSPRGARRGLLLAAVAAAIWIGWAVGYSQGAQKAAQPTPTSKTTKAPVNAQCCLQPLGT